MVTSGSNDGNDDYTRNAFNTSPRYHTTEHLFKDIDDRNTTLRSANIYSNVNRSLHVISNSKCVDKVMDKTCYCTRTSKVSRKVMENESSGSLTPVTGARSRELNSDSGPRGDHGGETQKTWSPIHIGDKHDDNLNKGSIRVQGPPVSTSSRNEGITMSKERTSGNNGRNEDNIRNAFDTSSRYCTTEPLFEDIDDRKMHCDLRI